MAVAAVAVADWLRPTHRYGEPNPAQVGQEPVGLLLPVRHQSAVGRSMRCLDVLDGVAQAEVGEG